MIQTIVSILILLEQGIKQRLSENSCWTASNFCPHFNCSIQTVALQYNGIMGENNAFVLHFVHHGNALFLSLNQTCFVLHFSYNTKMRKFNDISCHILIDKVNNENT